MRKMKIDTSQDHRPAGTSAKSCGKVSESHYPHALLLFDDVEISLMLRRISNPERSDRSSPRIDDRKLDAPDKIELFGNNAISIPVLCLWIKHICFNLYHRL
jgi:hypothetical protein